MVASPFPRFVREGGSSRHRRNTPMRSRFRAVDEHSISTLPSYPSDHCRKLLRGGVAQLLLVVTMMCDCVSRVTLGQHDNLAQLLHGLGFTL